MPRVSATEEPVPLFREQPGVGIRAELEGDLRDLATEGQRDDLPFFLGAP